MTMDVVIPYSPRPHQARLHQEVKRFNVLVMHRRFGKTVWAVNNLIRNVIRCPLPNARGAYVAPNFNQAKRVAWDYLKEFTLPIPGMKYNASELSCHFPNGDRISMLGAEKADSLRGIYLDDCVVDETAQINPVAWTQVIRPALSDREGSCTFIGTPKGRGNLFADLYHGVPEAGDDWYRDLQTYHDTNIIKETEIDALRNEMTVAEFGQEMECSWLAAIEGAYYAAEMNAAESEERITHVPYDENYPVHTAWDIGWSANNVIWFIQVIGSRIHVIDLHHCKFKKMSEIIKDVLAKPYQYGNHIAPHDMAKHSWETGSKRIDVARGLGIDFIQCPSIPVMDGIKAVQAVLPRCYFDRANTKVGVEALRQYRTEYNALLRTYSLKPLHSWESDYADAFRMFVVAMDGGARTLNYTQGDLDYSARDRMVV